MHGAVPLLRSTSALACQTTSKIPHLNFHILRRRTRTVNLRTIHISTLAQQRRGQSTTANWDDFRPFSVSQNDRETAAEQSATATPQDVDIQKSIARHTPVEGLEDVNFYSILERESPDLVLLAFSHQTIGEPFVRDAPDELFEKALLMLDPVRFIGSYQKIYRYLKMDEDEGLNRRGLRQIEARMQGYADLLLRIAEIRHDGKHKLTLDSCKHLLKWAGSLGHESMAIQVFEDIMKADEIEADVDCYNYYMEAMNWSHAYSQAEKFSMRVLPVNLKIRGQQRRPAKFSGYRTENPDTGNVGIRGEILQSFGQLVQKGHKANTLTFINMMIAMGREGDMKGVTSILKSVWNIDLGLLELYDEDEIESPTFYDEGHPLRPTDDLLFALAHIFGSNNDARTAWTLVDYVSRSYAIPIERRVWTELLEWYMVLCLRRGASSRRSGTSTGKITGAVFEQLFSSMVDQPHNIQPDSAAYYLQSRVRLDKRHLEEQLESIRGLRERLDESKKEMQQSMKRLIVCIQKMSQKPPWHLWDQGEFLELRQEFIKQSLEYEACLSMTRHATVQRLLSYNYWPGGRKETEWERRRLPNLIKEFAPFIPTVLEYPSSQGAISLQDANRCQRNPKEVNQPWYRFMVKLRKALDTEDYNALQQGTLFLMTEERQLQSRERVNIKSQDQPTSVQTR